MNIYNPETGKTENVCPELYETEMNIRSMFEQLCDSGINAAEVALFMTEAVTTARCERALTKTFSRKES